MISQYRHRDANTTDLPRISVSNVRVHRQSDDDYDHDYNPDNYKGIDPETAAEYLRQDRERIDAYNRGEWYAMGISASCSLWRNHPGHAQHVAEVFTGGLWGVESDSDESYIRSVEDDQLDELRDILADMGIPEDHIAAALRDAKR